MKKFFVHNQLKLEYLTIGTGADVIFCFHGFGRRAEDFLIFESLLKPNQRMVAVNLFAHEQSYFPEERINNSPLLLHEWKDIMEAFCTELHIQNFHLLGYSMGGRVCLMTVQCMPERVKSLLLIAPDGFKINPLYKFASGTALGKWIYRGIIKNPFALFKVAGLLHTTKLLPPKLYRFTHVHLDTRAKRQQVHDAWLIYKRMFPELKTVAKIINQNGLQYNMIFGEHDSIIKPKLGEKFNGILGTDKHMHTVPSGHRLLNENTLNYIQENNLWP